MSTARPGADPCDYSDRVQIQRGLKMIRGSMTPQELYKRLVESVRLVAAPSEVQFASVPNFVVVCDEVSTTFGEAFLLVPQLQEARILLPPAVAALSELDEHLARVPEAVRVAEDEGLRADHPFWEKARQLAAKALTALGEEYRAPNLTDVRWVPGESAT